MAKKTKKINLSQHTLDINPRSFDIEQFDFSEIEEYVAELAGSREYQYNAIRNILVYLWGGKYSSVVELAKVNYKKKEEIQARFQSEEHYLNMLPLPDRLSGVCHMATGTGKSYVIFAIAYLSILMGKVKRVLVLGPSSTIIEQGLTDKFKEYMYGEKGIKLREKLPEKYRNIRVEIKNSNETIEDNCIVIENINAIYSKDNNSIGDTLFSQTEEVLVLSDEVHHAYSHLDFTKPTLVYDFELGKEGKGEDRNERLWMKFIKEEKKIKRHIGFTGTPYNQDDYFTDVIFNYSIKDATDEKYIKKINPIIHVESDEGDVEMSKAQKYEQIIKTHFENVKRFNYEGKVKPITIFINNTQASAKKNSEEFRSALADYLKQNNLEFKDTPRSLLEAECYKKIIVPTSDTSKSEYQDELDNVEETDPNSVGGLVEFIFAVNKLSEGWDVDNVFQIVPMDERVFNSKLLISQVLGRGLRIPRKISQLQIMDNYPVVTVTNHEKFASHIKELLDQVMECDMAINSRIFQSNEESIRAGLNFNLFNINYVPTEKIVEKEDADPTINRTLKLNPQPEKLRINVQYLQGIKEFQLTKEFVNADQVVADVFRKFKNVIYEHESFGFEDTLDKNELPDKPEIEKIIYNAMKDAGIEGKLLSNENKKVIELYFNQLLPKGTKKVEKELQLGNIFEVSTKSIHTTSAKSGALDGELSVFVSEDWEEELDEQTKFFIKEIIKSSTQRSLEQAGLLTADTEGYDKALINNLAVNKNLFSVNSSVFKTPQNLIIANHQPERDFVYKLCQLGKYVDGWVKSPDSGFYSLDYEYWKAGKDRVRRSFNPDYFIRLDLAKYIKRVQPESSNISKLLELQDKGIEEIIYVIEVKGEDDFEEVTKAKDEYAKTYFRELNTQLEKANPINHPSANLKQYYVFELLRPDAFDIWASQIKFGNLKV